jgi:hypothetical protein
LTAESPSPTEAAASAIAIIVIRRYFMVPSILGNVVDGARRELIERRS